MSASGGGHESTRRAPRLLVVAGHDSSGGAGVDADREAASAFGAQVDCVVTAFTVQDARGVRDLGARDPATWLAETRACERPAALKLGLLPGAAHVEAAARLARELRERCGAGFAIVLDPVLAASSGYRFLDAGGIEALLRALPTLAPVLTPNLGEAAVLSGMSLDELERDPAARADAVRALAARGARAVVLKGGHGGEDPVLDLVLDADGRLERVEHPRVPGGGIRGSGCRHATALAAGLALGRGLVEASRAAGDYVAGLIAAAVRARG